MLLTHPYSHDHLTPGGHPEQVARIKAVDAALAAPRFDPLVRVEAPEATMDDLCLAHPADYVAQIRDAIPETGFNALDSDTFVSPGSYKAAVHAAGALIAGVDAVLDGTALNAFAAIRPPGHHAEKSTPMGFCLFGNVAIGALHALRRRGCKRVAIIDFDVHHGNGTQDILWDEPGALFCSTHQMPLYPGSGAATETGAHGNILNAPLAPNAGSAEFRDVMERVVLPAVSAFAPDLILISAGFDAHRADPLANLNLGEDDFAWVTGAICDIADQCCQGRVVSTLEGGYDLQALAASAAAHVGVLMERGQ